LSNNGDINVASTIIDRFVIGDSPFIELHINARNLRDNSNLSQRVSNQNLNLYNSVQSFSIAPRNEFISISTQTEHKKQIDQCIQSCIEKPIESDYTQTEILHLGNYGIQTEIDMAIMSQSFDRKMLDKECSIKPHVNNKIDVHIPYFSMNTFAQKLLIISSPPIKKQSFKNERKIFKASIDRINTNDYLTNQAETIQRPIIIPPKFRVTTRAKPFIGNFIIKKSQAKKN